MYAYMRIWAYIFSKGTKSMKNWEKNKIKEKMREMTHASVFSGIGAPEIAAEMLGWENVFHCEINEFGRRVLDYHYPNSKSYEDITKTDFSEWRGKVTVLTGGFPCQPFSYAGKRRGSEDDRYLWPFMLKCIEQVKPTWFVGENVAGITTMVFPGEDVKVGDRPHLFDESDGVGVYERRERYVLNEIIENLERVGYEVQTFLVPACAVGAPHRRDRVFIVAHRPSEDSDCVRCGGDDREEEPQIRKFGMSCAGSDEWICKKEDAWPSSNTDSHSNESGNAGEYESKGGEKQLQERNEVQWPVESDRLRREMDAISERTFSLGLEGRDDFQGELGELQERRSSDEASASARGDVFQGSSPNTDSTRQSTPDKQNRREWEKMDGRSESKSFDGVGRHGLYGIAADTESECCAGCQSELKKVSGQEQGQSGRDLGSDGDRGQRFGDGMLPENRWTGFPTQSPVYRRDDGVSFGVDTSAISPDKWVKEALKAYGNAIVPQVMYEIFRCIDIIENDYP